MKKYFNVLTFFVFILVIFYLFILPKIRTVRYSLRAAVVSISPPSKRSGKSEIAVKQGSAKRYLYYTFFDSIPEIQVGDTLIKEPNTKTLFIKDKQTGLIRKGVDQNYLLGP